MGGEGMSDDDLDPEEDLQRIVESARRLGVELDEEEALGWLTTMAVGEAGGDVTFDATTGVFGHRVSMMDFSTEDLEHFRRIGKIVEFTDEPGVVETALALSGSAAQSKIQSYPGDCDFFERVNIIAPTREQACLTLARVIREKALSAVEGPGYRLMEVRFGSYPEGLTVGGEPVSGSIAWTFDDLVRGHIDATAADGSAVEVGWEAVADQPGWCKLDWVVTDPVRRQVANASNMLDATWQQPDGTITPLDGYLDPYFQEVYLEAGSVPIFSKLVKHMSGDALDEYIDQLEHEIQKYLTQDVNYGKAAKRMYNVFRLTGRYDEAAYVRELFDEPATVLYQVWSLVRAIDDMLQSGADVAPAELITYADELIDRVRVLEDGAVEEETIKRLDRLRQILANPADQEDWAAAVEAARSEAMNTVNNFFQERLDAVPEVKTYMDGLSTPAA
jgi:hypothetical protein